MGMCAERFSDSVIITEDNNRTEKFEQIAKMIVGGMTLGKHITIKNRTEAIRTAIINSSPGDIVAIIGKGHEKYMISDTGRYDVDEEEIVKSALNERRSRNENKA
jgi:UDP-N-acetylmuramoyl-L-alanyl-D-glutamate--2,6-diaminopimelate ligase